MVGYPKSLRHEIDSGYIISDLDEYGRLIKRSRYDLDNSLELYSEMEYDVKGRLLLDTTYFPEYLVICTHQYEGNITIVHIRSESITGNVTETDLRYEMSSPDHFIEINGFNNLDDPLSVNLVQEAFGTPKQYVKSVWYDEDGSIIKIKEY